jgi:hypothetical protein
MPIFVTMIPSNILIRSDQDAQSFYMYEIILYIPDVLKGQCHEIFDPRFFHKTIPLRP